MLDINLNGILLGAPDTPAICIILQYQGEFLPRQAFCSTCNARRLRQSGLQLPVAKRVLNIWNGSR